MCVRGEVFSCRAVFRQQNLSGERVLSDNDCFVWRDWDLLTSRPLCVV
ncbi:hypothetical protein NRI_0085 [Neorickettsia risticii str. Illinois]|uniref:Uncharacterized protein n=1 Tax=Neorickettsia risticii (strain Illinois) TaxID=434131 RepID=C6V3W7_NEORI|nr:hypothetical protein NRI_0085 [Neorickettsia risticii str. Illinois]